MTQDTNDREKAEPREAERPVTAIEILTAGLLHEINTPLAAIHSNADTLDRLATALLAQPREDEPELPSVPSMPPMKDLLIEIARTTRAASQRLREAFDGLKKFVALDEAEFKTVEIAGSIDSVLLLIAPTLRRIEVERDFDGPGAVCCRPHAFHRLLLDLLLEATRWIEQEGRLAVRSRSGDFGVALEIAAFGASDRTDSKAPAVDEARARLGDLVEGRPAALHRSRRADGMTLVLELPRAGAADGGRSRIPKGGMDP